MTDRAWEGACRLAAGKVRELCRRLDKDGQAGLVVDPEQRRYLGQLADGLAALQHAPPERWADLTQELGVQDLLSQLERNRKGGGRG